MFTLLGHLAEFWWLYAAALGALAYTFWMLPLQGKDLGKLLRERLRAALRGEARPDRAVPPPPERPDAGSDRLWLGAVLVLIALAVLIGGRRWWG